MGKKVLTEQCSSLPSLAHTDSDTQSSDHQQLSTDNILTPERSHEDLLAGMKSLVFSSDDLDNAQANIGACPAGKDQVLSSGCKRFRSKLSALLFPLYVQHFNTIFLNVAKRR
jgi:hypothetical protein